MKPIISNFNSNVLSIQKYKKINLKNPGLFLKIKKYILKIIRIILKLLKILKILVILNFLMIWFKIN